MVHGPETEQPVRPDTSRHQPSSPYEAVLFDLDGVVTDTAALHAASWKQLFEAVLSDPRLDGDAGRASFDQDDDYRRFVDGRSREDGVTAFLTARGIHLPVGAADDPPQAWTINGLGARKDELFLSLLARHGVAIYTGTTELLGRLRAGRVPAALVSASRHAGTVLAAAGLDAMFDVVVDGEQAAALHLPGKPDPALFLEAARRLGVSPGRTAVIEDATAGVTAARRGAFGLVVGIDHTGRRREELESAGADVVLGDVGELDLGKSITDPWLLVYAGFDPAHEGHREVLTALGNGYMVTRGALPERSSDAVHYPGTYLAGIYNRLVSTVHARTMAEEQLVNVPNWLPLDVALGDSRWWSTGQLSAQGERHELDLRRGLLVRRAVLTGADGRRMDVVQRRLVSMDNPHLAALETTLTPLGWSGAITVRTDVDATVTNANTADEDAGTSQGRHLTPATFAQTDACTVLCEVQTSQSGIRIATAVRTVLVGGADVTTHEAEIAGSRYTQQFDARVEDGQSLTVTKTVAVATSRDVAISAPRSGALTELARNREGVAGLLSAHQVAWERLWDSFAIRIGADRQSQLVLNLHVFHLLQTVSPHTAALDAGVPARGLHGEGYRGHVFWDELFVLPVVGLRLPHVSAALLDYRWRRLGAARAAAQAAGLRGAMFPWQSGSDGREETPDQLYNTRSARWMPDNSLHQRHVGLAVAYNAWQHFQTTGDLTWLTERGAELIIEVTRMFASQATYDPRNDRFHVAGVMGPDEYHDGYPDAPGAGVRDNAYTNVLLSWVCDRAADSLDVLQGHPADDLADRLQVTSDERSLWQHLSARVAVPFHEDGILSQFDGYEDLAELDWAHYRATYHNIGRLDLILEAENDTTNRYKLAKQADALMLVHLLGPEVLLGQLGRLGYPMSLPDLGRTVEYYLARTAHGSTLSRVVHASVLARIDRAKAWAVFREALVADLDDTQGGTTREGIHLGAMAGTADLVVRSFAGLHSQAGVLTFTPRLPAQLRSVSFQVAYRGHRIDVSLTAEALRLELHPCRAAAVQIGVDHTRVWLEGGQTTTFPLHPPARRTPTPHQQPSKGRP